MQQPQPEQQQPTPSNVPGAAGATQRQEPSTSESMPPAHFLFNPTIQSYIMAPTHPNYHTHGVPSLSYDVFQQYPTHSGYQQQFGMGHQQPQFGYYATPPPAYGAYGGVSWGASYSNQPVSQGYGSAYGPGTVNTMTNSHRLGYESFPEYIAHPVADNITVSCSLRRNRHPKSDVDPHHPTLTQSVRHSRTDRVLPCRLRVTATSAAHQSHRARLSGAEVEVTLRDAM
jgi:hypothetical protein